MLASRYDFATCVVYPQRDLSRCQKGIRTKIFKNKTAAHSNASTLKHTQKQNTCTQLNSAHVYAVKSVLKKRFEFYGLYKTLI